MRRRSGNNYVAVAVVAVVGAVVGGVVVAVVAVGGGGVLRRRSRRSRGGARLGMAPPSPRSLRWVSVLLPGEEGGMWLAEVASCLAEAPDPGERRRYVRSYRLEAPRLIWVSWAEYLRGSRQRELS